jgi:ribosomal protein L44E
MPRGKKTVYNGSCTECGARIATVRILKAKKADFRKLRKYCANCRKRQAVKIKEEKHSA